VARIPGTDDIDESVYEPKFLLLDHLGSTRAELVFAESGGTFSPVIQEYYDLMPSAKSSTRRRRRRTCSSPANPETLSQVWTILVHATSVSTSVGG
jgi:hypothetical protein